MLVAIINENSVVASINDYPALKNIDDIRGNFLDDTILLEVKEKPQYKEGYQLKHNGSEFYYEEIPQQTLEPNQPTNAEVAQMISDLQADLIIAGVI
jgi:hypothetical protein